MMSHFPLGSEQKAGRPVLHGAKCSMELECDGVELGCDVLDKRADQTGQSSPLSDSISLDELL